MVERATGKQWETVRELSERVGVSEGWIRQQMHARELRFSKPGGKYLIPAGAWEEMIERNMVEAIGWDGETKEHGCATSRSAAPTTSVGAKAVEAASARRAQMTAEKLKSSSLVGSRSASETPGRVIPLKS